jgi:hypothetical protein
MRVTNKIYKHMSINALPSILVDDEKVFLLGLEIVKFARI